MPIVSREEFLKALNELGFVKKGEADRDQVRETHTHPCTLLNRTFTHYDICAIVYHPDSHIKWRQRAWFLPDKYNSDDVTGAGSDMEGRHYNLDGFRASYVRLVRGIQEEFIPAQQRALRKQMGALRLPRNLTALLRNE